MHKLYKMFFLTAQTATNTCLVTQMTFDGNVTYRNRFNPGTIIRMEKVDN